MLLLEQFFLTVGQTNFGNKIPFHHMFDPSGHPYFPGSNLILKGALDDYGSGNPINFASWMQYATIPMIINFFLCWLWLQMFYLGLPKKCSISRKSCNTKVNVFLVGPLKMTNKTPILNVIFVTFPTHLCNFFLCWMWLQM